MNKTVILSSILSIGLTSCTEVPHKAFSNPGDPQNLLEVTTEELTVDLAQRNSFQNLSMLIDRKDPSNATVYCSNPFICNRASEVLDQYNVPYDIVRGGGNKVTLEVSNIVARDCDNRFISNHTNPYNLNHPSFGCSTAVNEVQMVSDKRQIVDPLLLGKYDGEKATQNYDKYLQPVQPTLEAERVGSN